MNFALNRLACFARVLAILLIPLAARAVTPVFMTGASVTDSNAFYGTGSAFTSIPVGTTMVVPVAVSGSGPMAYTAVSSSHSLLPVIKTGYPVMNVHVTYTGTTGTFGVLHAFTGTDGASPSTGLAAGTGKVLFGVTATGGSNGFGVVYQISTTGTFAPVFSFTGGTDGSSPVGPLASGSSAGLLFGVTETGGTSGGFGTIYSLTTSGTLTTLHTFDGGVNGGNPFAGLTATTGSNAAFYGTTRNGGMSGFGTVFKVTSSGSFSTIYSFTGGNDGANPQSRLALDGSGNLFGTTIAGGTNSDGAIYEVTTTGSFVPLYSFSGGADGAKPYGNLAAGSGVLYGTAETGGTAGFGDVYAITSSGSFGALYSFSGGADGGNPYAGVVLASDGKLYGTAETDGTGGFGSIYQLSTTGSFAALYGFTGGADGGNPFGPLLEGVTGDLFGTASIGGANSEGVIFQIPLPNAGAFSGTMKFALLRDMAPVACGYISGFAQSGYYDGLDFFRITNLQSSSDPGFIAQGGDLTNTGTGSVGFTYDNEYNPALIFDGEGQLALANSGNDPNTFRGSNGSQFFFIKSAVRGLDFNYTIFGQLISGFDIMTKVTGVPLQSNPDGASPFKPVKPVVMDSVTVTEDNTDAILLVTGDGFLPGGANVVINATDPAGNKAVVQSGTVSTPGLTISMSTANDTANDPPFIVQDEDVNVGLHQKATLPFRAIDLEFDYLLSNAGALTFTGASVVDNGNTVTVSASPFNPVTSVPLGFLAEQVFVSGTNVSAARVGLGLGNLTGYSAELTGSAGGTMAPVTTPLDGVISLSGSACGAFMSGSPLLEPADFTAAINWGDGALTSGSTATSVVKGTVPGSFIVLSSSNHTYANPGIYPVVVTVTGSNGGKLQIRSTAVVSTGPIYPAGRTFTAAKGLINGLVASFSDNSGGANTKNYSTTINWGDGAIGKGTVRGSNGNFEVFGRHQYGVGTSYPVEVTVSATANGVSAEAWSTALITGVPAHVPPVAQSHVTGQIGNPGFNGNLLSEEITLVNSGDLASGPISLRFFLSTTAAVNPISANAIPLPVSGRSIYNVPSIKAGSALQGSVSNITLPANAVTRGKFIIMQVITSDPIATHMDSPHAFVNPFPLVE